MPVQAAILASVLGVLAFSSTPVVAAVITGLLALTWLGLDGAYAWELNREERREARARGDRQVSRIVLSALALSVSALVARAITGHRFWSSAALTVGSAAIAVFWLSAFSACLIDWYYVRSRRDGVVRDPPCRSSGHADWKSMTRIWYLHRAIVVIAGAVTAAVAAVAFGLAALGGTNGNDAVKVGSLLVAGAGASVGLTRLFYGGLASVGNVLTACCYVGPDIAVGDKLVGGGESFVKGYVRDVALEGLTVVVLDDEDVPERGPSGLRTKRHGLAHVLDKPDIQGVPFSPCSKGCVKINSDCCWFGRRDIKRRPTKHRLFVL